MQDHWAMEGDKTLSNLAAFDAMKAFLEAYWERGLKQSDDIAVLLGSLNRDPRADTPPLDIALWHDWLEAVQISRSE